MNRGFGTASFLALLLSLIAVVGTPRGGPPDVLCVLDVSRSHGPAPDLLRERLRQWHRRSAFADQGLRVILAGATAIAEGDPPPGMAEGSRVDLGLELARRTLGSAATVLVFSDGRFDHAAIATQVAALAEAGASVGFEGRLAEPAADLRLVPRGAAPVEAGRARVRAAITGTHRTPRKVGVTLVAGDAPEETTIVVEPGATEEWEAFVPVPPSARSVVLRLAHFDESDAVATNDTLVVPLERPERAAIVVGTGVSGSEVIREAVAEVGFALQTVATLRDLDVAALPGAELVVLVDQSLEGVPEDLVAALESAVTQGGLGLWAVGGEHAFGAGGYAGSRIDDLLPLSSRATKARHVTFILDTSGSMERDGRLDRAIEAITSLAGALGPDDRIQVIPFAQQPAQPVPGKPVSPAAFLATGLPVLKQVPPFGGTRLLPALDAALARPRVDGAKEVLVIITDARDDHADKAALDGRREIMTRDKIDSIVVLLDPIPETKARADAMATASVITATEYAPRIRMGVVGAEAFVAGPIASVRPDGAAGPVMVWRNRVRTGEGALVALTTAERDPLLASAFRGVGRTAAWAAWPASGDVALGKEWARTTARPAGWKGISARREESGLVIAMPPDRVPSGGLSARPATARMGPGVPLAERTPGVFDFRDPPAGDHLALVDGDRVVAVVAVPPAGDPEYAWPPFQPPAARAASRDAPARMRAPWAASAALCWAAAILLRSRGFPRNRRAPQSRS